ncbi:MAG: hypothetical protein II649_06430, partial [Kiritimatiellae bacterium]|nr:hypothetical protein [Kiritimatiellia bacterium]
MTAAILAAVFIAVDAPVPNHAGKGESDTARFVKTFERGGDVAKATWTVTGLGVFKAYFNGREVGADDQLKPG